tara:strand:+ start:3848 stop:4321 length:474 start_codon:yes stop_codon:yes gene_type:complete
MFKKSPLVAIILALTLGLYIYTSSVNPKIPMEQKQTLTLSEQIKEASLKIKNANSPEAQMRGILQLRNLSEKYPENPDLHWLMGMFSIQSSQFQKAIERFKNVIKLDSTRKEANIQLAVSYIAIDDTINARSVLQSLLIESEDDIKSRALMMLDKLK